MKSATASVRSNSSRKRCTIRIVQEDEGDRTWSMIDASEPGHLEIGGTSGSWTYRGKGHWLFLQDADNLPLMAFQDVPSHFLESFCVAILQGEGDLIDADGTAVDRVG